jgi:hypothetical protein
MYALLLLAPGSFVVLPVLWFARLIRTSGVPLVYSRKAPVDKIGAALYRQI